MGIRISMSLILGIDDLRLDMVDSWNITDSRWANKPFDNWHDKLIAIPPMPNPPLRKNLAAIVLHNFVKGLTHNPDSATLTQFRAGDVITHDPEYGVGSVMGVRIAQLPYAHEVLYALASLYPEFQREGYRVLPSIAAENDQTLMAIARRHGGLLDTVEHEMVKNKERLIDEGHNYMWFTMEIETWLAGALYILNAAGLQIERKDLKLMLYWQWS